MRGIERDCMMMRLSVRLQEVERGTRTRIPRQEGEEEKVNEGDTHKSKKGARLFEDEEQKPRSAYGKREPTYQLRD